MLLRVSEFWQPTPIILICAGHGLCRHARVGIQNGRDERGYQGAGRPFSSPGMAYWMVACSVYSYIAILGVNIRICRMEGVYARPTLGPGLWRAGGESGQYAGQATLEPFVGVQVRGLAHHSLQMWVAAAVQGMLQVRGDGGAPLLFGEPGTPLGPRLGQLSGGCTQYVRQDGLYGTAGGGRVVRIASRRSKGAFVVNQGMRADGRASS
jgi:hypothetical protein